MIALTRQKFFTKGTSKHTLNPNSTISNCNFGMKTIMPKNKNEKSELDFKLE